MSLDIFIASQVENPLPISSSNSNSMYYYHNQTDHDSIVNKSPSFFVKKEGDQEPEDSKKRTWEICAGVDKDMVADGGERKRRLVSLFEANEVAKRVASLKRERVGYGGGYGGNQIVVNGGLNDGEGKTDVVSEWMMGL